MKKESQVIDFYAEDQVEQVREILADYWSERLDGDAVASILLTGNEGYKNTNKETLLEEFESIFGEGYFSGD